MKERLETIGDVRNESEGLVQIDHNLGGDAAPLSEVQHLLFNPHHRPLVRTPEEVQTPVLPESFPILRNFLGTELGREVLKYSYRRADAGSTEIGKAIIEEFRRKGESALMLSPSAIGRGVLDLNRPANKAIDFPVPNGVGADLFKVYGVSLRALWSTFDVTQGHLKSVIQPHTMASGNPTDAEEEEVRAMAEEIRFDGDQYANPEKVEEVLDAWKNLYKLMSNRRDRLAVDIVNGMAVFKDGKPMKEEGKLVTQPIPDQGFSVHLAEFFDGIQTPWAFNDPFPHIPGYPGTDLALACAEGNIPQVTFDVPRYLLQTDSKSKVDALTFKPDPDHVKAVAEAVIRALNSLQR